MLDSQLQAKRQATVLEHMTAENAYEFERCLAAFTHPRYEIIPTGEVWDGHDGVHELLLQNKTAFPDFHFEPSAMHYADEAVIVEGRFRATHGGNWRGIPATSKKVDFQVIIVFLFEGENMVCERTYFNLIEPLEQIGIARDLNSFGGRISILLNHPFVILSGYLRQMFRR